jgi:putative NIF3 family GTP cyclohydrolase 1 type 2
MVTQNTDNYITKEITKSGLMDLQNHINPAIKLHHATQFAEFEKYNRETRAISRNRPRSEDNYNDGINKLRKINHY